MDPPTVGYDFDTQLIPDVYSIEDVVHFITNQDLMKKEEWEPSLNLQHKAFLQTLFWAIGATLSPSLFADILSKLKLNDKPIELLSLWLSTYSSVLPVQLSLFESKIAPWLHSSELSAQKVNS